jgi:hypothetical protein
MAWCLINYAQEQLYFAQHKEQKVYLFTDITIIYRVNSLFTPKFQSSKFSLTSEEIWHRTVLHWDDRMITSVVMMTPRACICWMLRSFVMNDANKQKQIEFYTATATKQKRNTSRVSNATAAISVRFRDKWEANLQNCPNMKNWLWYRISLNRCFKF